MTRKISKLAILAAALMVSSVAPAQPAPTTQTSPTDVTAAMTGSGPCIAAIDQLIVDLPTLRPVADTCTEALGARLNDVRRTCSGQNVHMMQIVSQLFQGCGEGQMPTSIQDTYDRPIAVRTVRPHHTTSNGHTNTDIVFMDPDIRWDAAARGYICGPTNTIPGCGGAPIRRVGRSFNPMDRKIYLSCFVVVACPTGTEVAPAPMPEPPAVTPGTNPPPSVEPPNPIDRSILSTLNQIVGLTEAMCGPRPWEPNRGCDRMRAFNTHMIEVNDRQDTRLTALESLQGQMDRRIAENARRTERLERRTLRMDLGVSCMGIIRTRNIGTAGCGGTARFHAMLTDNVGLSLGGIAAIGGTNATGTDVVGLLGGSVAIDYFATRNFALEFGIFHYSSYDPSGVHPNGLKDDLRGRFTGATFGLTYWFTDVVGFNAGVDLGWSRDYILLNNGNVGEPDGFGFGARVGLIFTVPGLFTDTPTAAPTLAPQRSAWDGVVVPGTAVAH